MRFHIIITLLFSAALMFSLSGCNGIDDVTAPEVNEGAFEATITGDRQESLSGLAFYFMSIDPVAGVSFSIGLGSSDLTKLIGFRRGGSGLPEVSTHPIANFYEIIVDNKGISNSQDQFFGIYLEWTNDEIENISTAFPSIAGELTITGTGNTIEGTFQFTGRGGSVSWEDSQFEEDLQISISGSFNAIEVPQIDEWDNIFKSGF